MLLHCTTVFNGCQVLCDNIGHMGGLYQWVEVPQTKVHCNVLYQGCSQRKVICIKLHLSLVLGVHLNVQGGRITQAVEAAIDNVAVCAVQVLWVTDDEVALYPEG